MLELKRKFLLHRLMDDVVVDKTVSGGGGDKTDTTTTTDGGKGGGGGDKTDVTGAFGDWTKTVDTYVTSRKGDDKLKARLTRYSDPGALIDAHLTLQEDISKGVFKRGLKADAKAEEVTKWRQENGIPETPDKYEIKLTGDRKVLPADKPLIEAVLAKFHTQNAPPALASAAVDAYYDIQQTLQDNLKRQDAETKAKTEHQLRVEWQGNYEPYKRDIEAFLDMAPKDVRDRLKGARLVDGTPLTEDVASNRWLLATARQVNPVSTVVPFGDSAGMQNAIESELAEIKKCMAAPPKSADWKRYHKGPEGEKMQARYRDLIDAQNAAKAK